MPDHVETPTCIKCYWHKLRWRDGSGMCWKHHEPRHADDEVCEFYDPKVIIVTADDEKES